MIFYIISNCEEFQNEFVKKKKRNPAIIRETRLIFLTRSKSEVFADNNG